MVCGYQTGLIWDTSRSNWQNDGSRPIAWSAWYPVDPSESGNEPKTGYFDLGNVMEGASLAGSSDFPVFLLSHGTGGVAESMGWLARRLAEIGFVVIAANHHGNCGLEPYCAEGFLCWWERPLDLSHLLTTLSKEGPFAGRLDINRVSAAGFSLGGYTVLAMVGAQTSLRHFNQWRQTNGITLRGPKEFPDAEDSFSDLQETSKPFRDSLERQENNMTDARVKSVFAIAPPPTVRGFSASSVQEIETPVMLLTGGADAEAPFDHCAKWLLEQNDSFQHHDLGIDVGHYTFLDFPSDRSLVGATDIFTDHARVDRAAVHDRAFRHILGALG